jgi:predicted aldo/keto reductase-like oxidoreductase
MNTALPAVIYRAEALAAVPADKQPSACIGCRSCEAVRPQQIKISESMADFTEKLKG